MTAPPSVLVVGSINVDIAVHAERLPAPGETVAGGRLERSRGGKGANQAVAAARAGASVALAGAVGDDDLGADALAALRAEGIDVGSVLRLERVTTGVALIVVDRDGRNQIAVASGANHELTAQHVEAATAGRSAEPVGSGNRPASAAGSRSAAATCSGARPGCVLASFELLDQPVIAAGRAARAAGCPLVVNPAPARPLAPALLELHPIVTPNQLEAAELTGERDPDAAASALTARTGAAVVITLGERGALVVEGAARERVPAPAVLAVDTTGAGDVFNGVLAAAFARGEELSAAVAVAVTAAADSVTRPGARG